MPGDPWDLSAPFLLLLATGNLILVRLKSTPRQNLFQDTVPINPLHECDLLFKTSEVWESGTQSKNDLKAISDFCTATYFH